MSERSAGLPAPTQGAQVAPFRATQSSRRGFPVRCEAELDSQEIRLPPLQFQLLHPARKVAYGSGSLARLASKGLDSERPQQAVGLVFAWEVSFDGGILDGCSGRGNNSTQGQSWPGRARRLSEGRVEGPRRFSGAGALLPSCSLPQGAFLCRPSLWKSRRGENPMWSRIFCQRPALLSRAGKQASAEPLKTPRPRTGRRAVCWSWENPRRLRGLARTRRTGPGIARNGHPLAHLEKATIYHCPTFLKTTKGSE